LTELAFICWTLRQMYQLSWLFTLHRTQLGNSFSSTRLRNVTVREAVLSYTPNPTIRHQDHPCATIRPPTGARRTSSS